MSVPSATESVSIVQVEPLQVQSPKSADASSPTVIEVPRSAVTLPPEYVSPDEKVVVATQLGTPETSASTCPLVPCDVVAKRDDPFPRRSVFACIDAQPVPPFETGRSPVTSAARSTSYVDTAPAVALRNPESVPMVSPPVVCMPANVDDADALIPEFAVLFHLRLFS